MKHFHIVIPDLFLPRPVAQEVCAGLHAPVLEKCLARSNAQVLPLHTLESWLCQVFAVPDMAIAPVTLMADGVAPGNAYWLRADPVHLRLERDQMILQTNVAPGPEEATQLCECLNGHFADSGMQFYAPHPQRWYLRLDADPQINTHSVYQVEGRNSRFYLPQGKEALHWHSVLNDIQMLLYGHAINRVREQQRCVTINSLWLWGGGCAATLAQPFERLSGDSELAQLFARAANICHASFSVEMAGIGNALHVWDGLSKALRRGDFHAWRQSLLNLEHTCLTPLLNALNAGTLDRITLDVLQENGSQRFELSRAMMWRVWKRAQPLGKR